MPGKDKSSSSSKAGSRKVSRSVPFNEETFYELLDETKHLTEKFKLLQNKVISLEKIISQMKNGPKPKEKKNSARCNNPIPRTVSVREYISGKSSRKTTLTGKTKKSKPDSKVVAKKQTVPEKDKISKSNAEGSGKRQNYRSLQRQHRRLLIRFLNEEPLSNRCGEKVFLHPNSKVKLLKSDHDLNSKGSFEEMAQSWRKEFSRLYNNYRAALRRLVLSRKAEIAPGDDLMKESYEEKVTPVIGTKLDELGEIAGSDSWRNIMESETWNVGTREPIEKTDHSSVASNLYAPKQSELWPYTPLTGGGEVSAQESSDGETGLENYLVEIHHGGGSD